MGKTLSGQNYRVVCLLSPFLLLWLQLLPLSTLRPLFLFLRPHFPFISPPQKLPSDRNKQKNGKEWETPAVVVHTTNYFLYIKRQALPAAVAPPGGQAPTMIELSTLFPFEDVLGGMEVVKGFNMHRKTFLFL